VVRARRPAGTNFGISDISRRSSPVIAEEDAEPHAAVADNEDADDEDEGADDAAEVPEIEADLDADVDPAIVRD